MAKKKIITHKNSLIRKVSDEVKDIDGEIRELLSDMTVLMAKNNGIGLAAIQIGVPRRVITIDLTRSEDDTIIKPVKIELVNPKILSTSQRTESAVEGCLSVPGKQGEVERFFWIELEGYTPDGKRFQRKLYDLAARVAQHEIDHLNGVLFTDKIKEKKDIKEGDGIHI